MRYIIGIDEVGRGSLAGSVTVAAVAAPAGFTVRNRKLGPLKDSKKLSPLAREKWRRYFAEHPRISYAIARVYPRAIERMNISRAANLAALRAFHRLLKHTSLPESRTRIFLDGGLFLGNNTEFPRSKTVVRGDEKFQVIKIASIIAKVSRDRFMKRLAKRYPRYGFEIHKGYGTRAHLRAIKKYGPSEAHRLTFIPKSSRM